MHKGNTIVHSNIWLNPTAKTKVVKIIIAVMSVQEHWQILSFPFSANTRCPTCLAVLPVCRIPTRLMPIYNRHDTRITSSGD